MSTTFSKYCLYIMSNLFNFSFCSKEFHIHLWLLFYRGNCLLSQTNSDNKEKFKEKKVGGDDEMLILGRWDTSSIVSVWSLYFNPHNS